MGGRFIYNGSAATPHSFQNPPLGNCRPIIFILLLSCISPPTTRRPSFFHNKRITMKRALLLAGVCITLSNLASAHIWRVNNDPSKSADFALINDAIAAAAPGDTIHIEPSATAYPNFLLNKRLVILGNGYFLGGGNLQVDKDSSMANSMVVDSSSATANGSGSFIAGMTFNSVSFLHNVHDVTLTRCHVTGQVNITAFDRPATGITITKNFIESFIVSAFFSAQVTATTENNIFSTATGTGGASINLDANVTGLFRNNTVNFFQAGMTLNNFYIANNVFVSANMAAITGGSNIIRNNSFAAPTVTNVTDGADGNHTDVDMSALFTGSTSAGYGDSRFRTAGPGVLRGTGETIGGITPDRGAYNTVAATDSYRTSGIPPIPSIYRLTVPVSVDPSATTVDIILSTRSNN